jgi:hypothetical protein
MEIPLTSFIDYTLKTGTPKMTCAKKIKGQMSEHYDPAKDFYKRFRDSVQKLHKNDLHKNELSKIVGTIDFKKASIYSAMITGYKKFLGKKEITWFTPPRKKWKPSSLEIPINPELGLEWDETKYVIKLYLKADAPTKDRSSSILALMNHTLKIKGVEYALLDVRNSKLHIFENSMASLIPLVEAEAVSLESVIKNI